MRTAYSVESIRRVEAAASSDLMAHAAFAIAARSADLLSDLHGRVYGAHVLLLIGAGANGGDALFAGGHLARRGAFVEAFVMGARHHAAGMEYFKEAGGRVATTIPNHCDLIIDGIVGMGSQGALDTLPLLPEAFVLSIDLPSGVIPDTGEIDGTHIIADLTMATGAYKVAHLVDPARDACGVIELIDLGLDFTAEPSQFLSWQSHDVADLLRHIEVDKSIVDKYRRGVVGLCAGSKEYPGAGVLCTDAALATGAGMVRVFSDLDIRNERPEVVAVDGQVQSLVVGPGLLSFDASTELLKREVPAVVDAGAIAHLAKGRKNSIITPHAGELAQLLECERSWVESHRVQALERAVAMMQTVVLLKGSTSLIGAPDGRRAANPTGSAALATAGSGDVLAGVIGALLAQGAEPFEAAVAGSFLHGIAGAYAESAGASGIAQMVPAAVASIKEY